MNASFIINYSKSKQKFKNIQAYFQSKLVISTLHKNVNLKLSPLIRDTLTFDMHI